MSAPAASRDAARIWSRLTPAQEEFLRRWNETRTGYPREASVAELFEDEAARRPGAVALVDAATGATLTYDALNGRANRLAHRLRTLGVRPETRVAIHLERGLDGVVAMLGVLKAGGAYVPVDPTLPFERAAFVLEDAAPAVVVTREALADALPSSSAALVCLDGDGALAAASDRNPERTGSAASLAHILYTSGSTGRPKGVAVLQRGVVRLVRETSYARFGADETFLHAAPTSFDASTFEIWGALLNGGRVVVVPSATPGLDELVDAIARHGVTTAWLTAGLFHLAVAERLEGLRPLRQLLAGGDVLAVERVRAVRRAIPGLALVNGYGPTEGTTFSACHTIGDLAEGAGTVPIGRPIANTQVYLLDAEMRWVPPGEEGELWIGGDGLARGYWNRPDLTAESFVPCPVGSSGAERLYRTGDVARLDADGRLEFLGRRDQQVKIQGYRVELGEIEAALGRHPFVEQAAVDARPGPSGGRRVVAWVVPADGAAPDERALRAFLQKSLPDYMLPSAFVTLTALPLTQNGKVDRRGLVEPTAAAASAESVSAPPASPLEQGIAAVWAEVLGVPAVDCEQNFFDLGGSSLLLIEAHAKLQKRLGRTLPITALFEHSTVRALARSLDATAAAPDPLRARLDRVRGRQEASS